MSQGHQIPKCFCYTRQPLHFLMISLPVSSSSDELVFDSNIDNSILKRNGRQLGEGSKSHTLLVNVMNFPPLLQANCRPRKRHPQYHAAMRGVRRWARVPADASRHLGASVSPWRPLSVGRGSQPSQLKAVSAEAREFNLFTSCSRCGDTTGAPANTLWIVRV